MKTKSILLSSLLLINFSYEALAIAHPQRPITNGTTISDKDYTDYEYFMRISKYDDKQPTCGGTLINKDFVLTAAHCVVNGHNEAWAGYEHRMTIYFGKPSGYSIATDKRKVSKIYLPPKFKETGYHNNDIALLKLDKPIEDITPITLNFQDKYAGKEAQVIGYGATTMMSDISVNYPDRLQSTYVDIVPHTNCNLNDSTKEICATSKIDLSSSEQKPPYSNALWGDSGGPLLLHDNNATTQIGIVSDGIEKIKHNKNVKYTNIAKYKAFIEDTIKND